MEAAASSQHSVTSTDVEDIWLEIFKRLPVKTLCRFRCVCKSWNSLFSSTFFITFHHNFVVSERPANNKAYIMVDRLERPDIPGYAVYHPHLRIAGSECITNIGLPYPNLGGCRNFNLVDVIDGVACLVKIGGASTVFFWNPVACKYISVTGQKYWDKKWRLYVGFGFSVSKSDFKAVVLSATPYYTIYSVREGSWRRYSLPGDIHRGYTPLNHGLFVNGTIYWITGRMTDGELHISMRSFDCEREEFKSIELPHELSVIRCLRLLMLFKFNEKLSVLRRGGSSELPLELWVMEDGANNTWNKLFNINNHFKSECLLGHDILVAQDGTMFVLGRDELSSADLPCEPGTLHQPLNGLAFRESLFLTDVKGKPEDKSEGKYEGKSSSLSSSLKGWQCKDGKIYSGHRFRALEVLNVFLDVAAKLVANA